MDLQRLKDILEKHHKELYPNMNFCDASFATKNGDLFPHLTEEEFKEVKKLLEKGDGNPLKEIYKINSSTSLAVYYYTLFRSEYKKEIRCFDLEKKIGIPLIEKNVRLYYPKHPLLRSANIDVLYGMNDSLHFVESKFLEPYYSTTQSLSEVYFDKRNYGENAEIWVRYAERINANLKDYRYYDITQMFKHLLAIYNHRDKWKTYSNLILLNASWKMPDDFKKLIESNRSLSYLKKRQEQMERQKNTGIELLNSIIQELKWNNCKAEYQHYNDFQMLEKIKNTSSFQDFTSRYLI